MTHDPQAGDPRTIGGFLASLSAQSPTPGGGSASALAIALGAALTGMVANLTVGKERYAESDTLARNVVMAATGLRDELQALMAADEAAYAAVRDAYARPRGAPDEQGMRAAAIHNALVAAMQPPQMMMSAGCAALRLALEMARHGNRSLASDAACAAILIEAGIRSAAYNVLANVVLLHDSVEARTARQEISVCEAEAATLLRETIAAVRASMGLEEAS
ncbi:MAG TPA: cyclodeaminase/cyclohydrolase family protein [Ktedonobacterales bacterium]